MRLQSHFLKDQGVLLYSKSDNSCFILSFTQLNKGTPTQANLQ